MDITGNGQVHSHPICTFADDVVILIDAHERNDWLVRAVEKATA